MACLWERKERLVGKVLIHLGEVCTGVDVRMVDAGHALVAAGGGVLGVKVVLLVHVITLCAVARIRGRIELMPARHLVAAANDADERRRGGTRDEATTFLGLGLARVREDLVQDRCGNRHGLEIRIDFDAAAHGGSLDESPRGRDAPPGFARRYDRRVENEQERMIRPDGLTIRGLRHTRGWSLRDLSAAISEAHESATGLPVRLAPRLLSSVEERNALISYATLCWIGSGLDCNPIEILLEDPPGVPSAGF